MNSELGRGDERVKNPCPICGLEMESGVLTVVGYFAGWMADVNWATTTPDGSPTSSVERLGRSHPTKGFGIDGFRCRVCRLVLLRY